MFLVWWGPMVYQELWKEEEELFHKKKERNYRRSFQLRSRYKMNWTVVEEMQKEMLKEILQKEMSKNRKDL